MCTHTYVYTCLECVLRSQVSMASLVRKARCVSILSSRVIRILYRTEKGRAVVASCQFLGTKETRNRRKQVAVSAGPDAVRSVDLVFFSNHLVFSLLVSIWFCTYRQAKAPSWTRGSGPAPPVRAHLVAGVPFPYCSDPWPLLGTACNGRLGAVRWAAVSSGGPLREKSPSTLRVCIYVHICSFWEHWPAAALLRRSPNLARSSRGDQIAPLLVQERSLRFGRCEMGFATPGGLYWIPRQSLAVTAFPTSGAQEDRLGTRVAT